jgi:hypothetical protein
MSDMQIVAWDWFHHRRYGAPGETRHNVLFVEDYRLANGTTPDLDNLLEHYRDNKSTEGHTIHVRPLYAAE